MQDITRKEFDKFFKKNFVVLEDTRLGTHVKKAMFKAWSFQSKRYAKVINDYKKMNENLRDALDSSLDIAKIAAEQVTQIKHELNMEKERAQRLEGLLLRAIDVLHPDLMYSPAERIEFLTELEKETGGV